MTPFRTGLTLTLCLLPLAALGQEAPKEPVAVDRHGDPLPRHVRARLGTVRFRQGSPVSNLRYSLDGKTLMSAGNDGSLRVWEARSGKELFTFGGVEVQNLQIMGGTWVVSPDGKKVAVWDGTQPVRLFDVATGQVLVKLGDTQNRGNNNFMAFSPDGKFFASLGNEPTMGYGLIRIFDVETGKEVKVLEGAAPKKENEQRFTPNNLNYSPDGKYLCAGGNDGRRNDAIRVWEVESGKVMPEPLSPGAKKTVADLIGEVIGGPNMGEFYNQVGAPMFSPDGKLMLGVIQDNRRGGVKLRLWDPVTGKHVRDLGDHPNGVNNVVFSPDAKKLAVMRGDQTAQLYDLSNGKELPGLAIAGGGIQDLVFSPDSKTAAIGASDQSVKIHEVETGKEVRSIAGYMGNFGQVNLYQMNRGIGSTIAFSPDGKLIAMAGGSMVRVFDASSGKEVNPTEGHQGNVTGVAIAPDSKTAATTSEDGTIRLWDLASGKELRQMSPPQAEEGAAANAFFGNAAVAGGVTLLFSPNGKQLAGSWNDGAVILWNVENGKVLHRMKAHDYGLCSLAFAPNGKGLASGGTDGRVLWWDTNTGKQIRQFAGPAVGMMEPEAMTFEIVAGSGAMCVAISPDGRTLAAAGQSGADYDIQMWEISSGKLRRKIPIRNFGGENDLFESNLRISRSIAFRGGMGTACLTFAPDGRSIAWASGSTVRLWDVLRGKELRQFGGQEGIISGMAFAPSGKYLIAGNSDGSLRVWDVPSGTIVNQLTGHRGSVSTLAFVGDGKTLASGGADTSVLLWDVDGAVEEETHPGAPSAKVLAELWRKLADEDAAKALESSGKLAAAPKEAVALLREQIKAAAPVDQKMLDKLMTDLQDNRFGVRKKATDELEKLGELAEPTLRKCLEGNPPLEVKQRVEALLKKLDGPVTHPEVLRALRALEVLEQIGTPEAQEVLKTIAQGAPEAQLTQDAKAALDRLGRQTK